MKRFLVIAVVATFATTSKSSLLQNLPFRSLRRTTHQPAYVLPENFRADNIPELEIPSKAFCEKQAMMPSDRYLVLPWWYQYCLNYMEKALSPYSHGKYYLPLYRRVLDQALQYKKYKQDLERTILGLKPQ